MRKSLLSAGKPFLASPCQRWPSLMRATSAQARRCDFVCLGGGCVVADEKQAFCSLATHVEGLCSLGHAPSTKQRGFAHWPRTSSLEMEHKRCELFLIWTCHAMQCRSFAMGDTPARFPGAHRRIRRLPGSCCPGLDEDLLQRGVTSAPWTQFLAIVPCEARGSRMMARRSPIRSARSWL